MDVGSWLRSLGLGQYEAAFRENAITEKVLPHLTADDLKDLGVTVVGHRRLLLDAVTDLRSGTMPIEAPSPPFETTAPPIAQAVKAANDAMAVLVNIRDKLAKTIEATEQDTGVVVEDDFGGILEAYQGYLKKDKDQ